MPLKLHQYLGLILIVGLAFIPLVAGAIITVLTGFAWAVIICVCLGALAGRYIPTGHYGEGASLVVWIWILLAVGIFVGLIARLLLP